MASSRSPPLRLFIDAGVVIDGCSNTWGASKALLILATQQQYFTILLADVIDREIQRALTHKGRQISLAGVQDFLSAYHGWLGRTRVERIPAPSPATIASYAPTILPALRHINDLRAAINAVESRPDWVLSTNTAHWSPSLAARTRLRITHPWSFLAYLSNPHR